jgi:chromosome segregation ATPase
MSKSLATSAQQLKRENDELSANNDDLRATLNSMQTKLDEFTEHNDQLSKLSNELTDDLAVLRGAIGAVGTTGNDIMDRLRKIWKNYHKENQRHEMLIKAQTRLQLVQIMQHYDTNTDACLDDQELAAAKAYLQAVFPRGDVDALIHQAARSDVTIDDLLAALDRP